MSSVPYQTSYKTQNLEDVEVRLERATLNRLTGEWTSAQDPIQLVIDSFNLSFPTSEVNVKPGQSQIKATHVTDYGWEIKLKFKAQIDDYEQGMFRHALFIAGGGYWREWIVWLFEGGVWTPYYCECIDPGISGEDGGTCEVTFKNGRVY